MFRLWAKEFKDNRMLRDMVICDDSDVDTHTIKFSMRWMEICYEFDLSKPIWLDVTIAEFKKHAKARFIRIILWIPLILIIWRSRSLRSSI